MVSSSRLDFIAEIGINHNGSFDFARTLIDAAAESGATIAKFQTYFASTRVSVDSPIYGLLKQCELSFEDFIRLKEHTEDLGLVFSSTPFCLESYNFLQSINTSHIKIASFHFANSVLLRHILSNCENISCLIMSTGLSSPQLIASNSNLINSCFGDKVADRVRYLHCVSQYPVVDISNYNLSNIQMLKSMTQCPVGYSDHSLGTKAAELSVALGACMIEKHFTTDNSLKGADHHFSATPAIFKNMVDKCNNVNIMLGTPRTQDVYDCEKDILPYNIVT